MITIERVRDDTGQRCSWCDGDVAPPILTMTGVKVHAAICRPCAIKLVNAFVFMVSSVTGQTVRKLLGMTVKPRPRGKR